MRSLLREKPACADMKHEKSRLRAPPQGNKAMAFIDPDSHPAMLRHGLKTGIAAVLAYGLACLFHLKYGYWAALSAVIVMQVYVADSVQMCLYRFSGTAVGAVIGMAAMFSAIVRAPLTGVVLIIEMTGNYEQIFPLLVACTIAYGVAELFHVKPIYEALLENDLERGQTQESPHGGPVLLDVIVEPDSQMDGCRIKDLAVPRGCLLVTVRRGWRDIVPSGNTRLRAGDRLTAIVAGDAPEACLILRERGRGQG